MHHAHMAFAPDGSFYVADSRNNRILHFDAAGRFLEQWGQRSGNIRNNPNPSAPAGTFNEPWGVAVGPDGSVYVTDTWNYRVQKFTANGNSSRCGPRTAPGSSRHSTVRAASRSMAAAGCWWWTPATSGSSYSMPGRELPDAIWLGGSGSRAVR